MLAQQPRQLRALLLKLGRGPPSKSNAPGVFPSSVKGLAKVLVGSRPPGHSSTPTAAFRPEVISASSSVHGVRSSATTSCACSRFFAMRAPGSFGSSCCSVTVFAVCIVRFRYRRLFHPRIRAACPCSLLLPQPGARGRRCGYCPSVHPQRPLLLAEP